MSKGGGKDRNDLNKKGTCKEGCLQDKTCVAYQERNSYGAKWKCRHFKTTPKQFKRSSTYKFYRIERCEESEFLFD